MPDMQIERLRSLVAVATYSGVSGAAEALHLGRATVSGHIKKLERDLQCALLRPYGRGVTLTADGEVLVERARRIIEIHDDAVAELAPPGERTLVVAASEHAAEFLVPKITTVLRQSIPDLNIRLRLTRSEKAHDMYRGERADIALFLRNPARETIKVADLPLEWVGVEGTAQQSIVVFDRPCALRDQAIATLTGRGYTVVKECPDLATVLSAVANGEGISPLPRTGPRARGFTAVTSLPPIPPVPLYLAASARVPTDVVRAVVSELRGYLRTS